jgi:hypothetical protein
LKNVLCGPWLPWLQDALFVVCAEAEETVEHRAYDTSHQSETAGLRNTRLMREYYGSPSCDGQRLSLITKMISSLYKNL